MLEVSGISLNKSNLTCTF